MKNLLCLLVGLLALSGSISAQDQTISCISFTLDIDELWRAKLKLEERAYITYSYTELDSGHRAKTVQFIPYTGDAVVEIEQLKPKVNYGINVEIRAAQTNKICLAGYFEAALCAQTHLSCAVVMQPPLGKIHLRLVDLPPTPPSLTAWYQTKIHIFFTNILDPSECFEADCGKWICGLSHDDIYGEACLPEIPIGLWSIMVVLENDQGDPIAANRLTVEVSLNLTVDVEIVGLKLLPKLDNDTAPNLEEPQLAPSPPPVSPLPPINPPNSRCLRPRLVSLVLPAPNSGAVFYWYTKKK